MTHSLLRYPQQIAAAAAQLQQLQDSLTMAQDSIASFTAEIEAAIAGDETLKNDTQRKAQRLERQREPEYVQAQTEARRFQNAIAIQSIEVQRLRDEFGAHKLLLRRECAELEAAA
jgi:hypothetical protein